jgi:hypothetical protein
LSLTQWIIDNHIANRVSTTTIALPTRKTVVEKIRHGVQAGVQEGAIIHIEKDSKGNNTHNSTHNSTQVYLRINPVQENHRTINTPSSRTSRPIS